MSEKPILFSGEMVRAILEGRKTQTRRVVKPQPHKDVNVCLLRDGKLQTYQDKASGRVHIFEEGQGVKCPYGSPGDLLWVRETWTCPGYEKWKPSEIPSGMNVRYRVTNDKPYQPYIWRPSIFMPRWASRITLRVTDVRVERVFDISIGECEAEGIVAPPHGLKPEFKILWDSINAKRGYGWDINPWVWVVEFKVVE